MTPLQIEIIKKFGRKDLSFGCVIYYNISPYIFLDERIWYYTVYCCDSVDWIFWYEEIKEKEKVKILWHLPLLEDIFRVAKDKDFDLFQVVYHDKMWSTESQQGIFAIDNMSKSVRIPYNPTLPLIEQDESTLSQLLSLFK